MPLLSITEAVGTGSTMHVAVPPYLDKSHIKVYIDALPTEAFEWVNAQTVSLIAPLNRKVRVVRKTSQAQLLTQYLDGTSLPGDTLEVDSKQAFYMAQEALDLAYLGGTAGGNPTPGVELTTEGILALLNGQITPSQLELDLRSDIELIKADAATIGSPAWRVEQERLAREGALQAEYEARVAAIQNEADERYAAIAAEATLREEADGILASQVSTVAAQVGTNTAAIQSEQFARVEADEALASDITTVVAFVDGMDDRIAAVETAAESVVDDIEGVKAQWTVKVQARSDGKKAIAGIGLSATSSEEVTQSEMVFLADKFTFVPSMADINTIPQPLLVMGLVNGVNTLVVPPSRYGDQLIEARMIVDGGIETRHMKVTGGYGSSLWRDVNAAEPGSWVNGAHGPTAEFGLVTSDGISGTTVLRATGTGKSAEGNPRVPVVAGRRYRISCHARRSVTCNGTLYLRAAVGAQPGVTVDQAFPGSPYVAEFTGGVEGVFPPTTWTRYSWEVVFAAGVRYASPRLILNWAGSDGWMEAQDIRIEEMLDYSLVVEGGLKADRIDTRGLTIKDGAGTVLFGAGTGLNWSLINGQPGGIYNSNISLNSDGTLSGAGGGQVTYSGIGGKALGLIDAITPSNASTYIADAWIGNAIFSGQLQSSNYSSGSTGYAITKDGNVEIWNLVARGNIWASAVYANAVHTAGIQADSVSSSNASSSTQVNSLSTTETTYLVTPINVSSFSRGVSVKGLFKITYQNTSPLYITLRRDGAPIRSWTLAGPSGGEGAPPVLDYYIPFHLVDSPGAGSHQYTLTARTSTTVDGLRQIGDRALECLSLNR